MTRTQEYIAAAAATLALTGGSLAAVAASGGLGATSYRVHLASATCAVPALPGQRVSVMLADMPGRYGGWMMGGGSMMGGRMMLRPVPTAVHAGTVSILAVNHGSRTHELVVLPLPAGTTAGSRSVGAADRVDESGSLGEASANCGAGEGDGIHAGSAGWVTLTLPPGRYELLCNLPGHYAAGMFAELDVSA